MFPQIPSQDNVNTRPPTSAKTQPVPPNAGSTVLPAICRAWVAQGGEPESVAEGRRCWDLEGLSLAARHRETFQPARRTRTSAREPCLLRFHPGSTSETARKQPGARQALSPTYVYLGHRPPARKPLPTARGSDIGMWLLRGHNAQQLAFLTCTPNRLP